MRISRFTKDLPLAAGLWPWQTSKVGENNKVLKPWGKKPQRIIINVTWWKMLGNLKRWFTISSPNNDSTSLILFLS